MPGKLRSLSGDEVVRILGRFGFEVAAQRGSHVKLVRVAPDGRREVLTIPRHRELRPGTLRAIYRQACAFIDAEQLRPCFFAD